MKALDPSQMLGRVRALPAGGPLLAQLEGEPGIYLVGGAVRDLLLGGEPSDLDLVVEGDPVGPASRLGGEIVAHDRFGTSTVKVGDFSYDIARARREAYSRPGALPDVRPATLAEDLARRDFTVNAIALGLGGGSAGQLTAFPGALDDLQRHTLRILHDRSFIDDPTRLLRLARYRGRLGFEIDPDTRALAGGAIAAGALGTVSGARIGNELRLLLREQDPLGGLQALRELELDRALAPGFGADDDGLGRRALALLPDDARPDLLGLALAGRRMAPEQLWQLLDALGFLAGDRDAVVAAANAPALAEALAGAERPSQIARVAAGAPPEAVALAGALGAEGPAREWLDHLRSVALEIDGGDLLAAGVPEGPALGNGLRAALYAKLDGRAQGRQAELAAALEAARSTG